MLSRTRQSNRVSLIEGEGAIGPTYDSVIFFGHNLILLGFPGKFLIIH